MLWNLDGNLALSSVFLSNFGKGKGPLMHTKLTEEVALEIQS
jgi:hypothetical protein